MTHIYPMGKLKIGDFEMNTHSQKSSNHFFLFANHFLSYTKKELLPLHGSYLLLLPVVGRGSPGSQSRDTLTMTMTIINLELRGTLYVLCGDQK